MGSFLQTFLTAKPVPTKKKIAYFYDSTCALLCSIRASRERPQCIHGKVRTVRFDHRVQMRLVTITTVLRTP
jgi:hypothetical protein